MAMHVKR